MSNMVQFVGGPLDGETLPVESGVYEGLQLMVRWVGCHMDEYWLKWSYVLVSQGRMKFAGYGNGVKGADQ